MAARVSFQWAILNTLNTNIYTSDKRHFFCGPLRASSKITADFTISDRKFKVSKQKVNYGKHLHQHMLIWLTFLLLLFSVCNRCILSPSLSLIRHGWIPFVFLLLLALHRTHAHTHSHEAHCMLFLGCGVMTSRFTAPNGADVRNVIVDHNF